MCTQAVVIFQLPVLYYITILYSVVIHVGVTFSDRLLAIVVLSAIPARLAGY